MLRCGKRLSATEDEVRDQELRADHSRRADSSREEAASMATTTTTNTHTE